MRCKESFPTNTLERTSRKQELFALCSFAVPGVSGGREQKRSTFQFLLLWPVYPAPSPSLSPPLLPCTGGSYAHNPHCTTGMQRGHLSAHLPTCLPIPIPHPTANALRSLVLLRRRVSPSQPTEPVAAVDVANVVLKASEWRRANAIYRSCFALLCCAGLGSDCLRCVMLRSLITPTPRLTMPSLMSAGGCQHQPAHCGGVLHDWPLHAGLCQRGAARWVKSWCFRLLTSCFWSVQPLAPAWTGILLLHPGAGGAGYFEGTVEFLLSLRLPFVPPCARSPSFPTFTGLYSAQALPGPAAASRLHPNLSPTHVSVHHPSLSAGLRRAKFAWPNRRSCLQFEPHPHAFMYLAPYCCRAAARGVCLARRAAAAGVPRRQVERGAQHPVRGGEGQVRRRVRPDVRRRPDEKRGVHVRRRRSERKWGPCTEEMKRCFKCSASCGRAGSGGEVCAGTPRVAPPQGLRGRRGLMATMCCQLLSALDGRRQGKQEGQCCRRCSSIAWTGARVPSGRAALAQGTTTRLCHAWQLTIDFLSK